MCDRFSSIERPSSPLSSHSHTLELSREKYVVNRRRLRRRRPGSTRRARGPRAAAARTGRVGHVTVRAMADDVKARARASRPPRWEGWRRRCRRRRRAAPAVDKGKPRQPVVACACVYACLCVLARARVLVCVCVRVHLPVRRRTRCARYFFRFSLQKTRRPNHSVGFRENTLEPTMPPKPGRHIVIV